MNYVLTGTNIPLDMGELCKVVNLSLNGKGGGRGTLAQGSAPVRPGITETVEQLKNYCLQIL